MWGRMIIQSLSGKKIFETRHKRMRDTLEEAVCKGIDLSFADVRGHKLSGAALDGIIAAGASFWGADLSGTDIGYATLHAADFRCADVSDACFAHSNVTGANMTGAYFGGTILESAVMDRVRVSCPSFWSNDLQSMKSMIGLVYIHKGEEEFVVDKPLIIRGMERPLVLQENLCLWGDILYRKGPIPQGLNAILQDLNSTIEGIWQRNRRLQNAIRPNLKRDKYQGRF